MTNRTFIMEQNLFIYFVFFFVMFIDRCTCTPLLISNNVTRCHDLILPDQPYAFALCFQRGSNKQHPYNLFTAPTFCTSQYPSSAQLIDVLTLPSDIVETLFESIKVLLNEKPAKIDLPEPNFLWIAANWTKTNDKEQFWCPEQCQSKGQPEKYLILKTRCSFNTTNGPCLTTRHTHWDRAPFICVYNQTTIVSPSTSTLTTITTTITTTTTTVTEQVIRKKTLPPIPPNETRIFYDSDSCLVARTRTHQYTFCFRRQNCSHSPSSAFCTTKYQAQTICYTEKNQSNLLTIDNNEEYRLINEIISQYSDESLLNCEGRQISKYVVRAQWMWINGIRNSEDQYHWNVTYGAIPDHLWCDQKANCSGGKGRDHIVLNIICQTNDNRQQICLASRRASEPGPFVCKRRLTDHEESIKNYTILRPIVKRVTSTSTSTTTLRPIVPVYEKSSTRIYYDEDYCLTVQSSTHLYSFCFRRQICPLRQAYCTKWSQAEKQCQMRKNNAHLLTIENQREQQLVSDVINEYSEETRLTLNGSSYEYFRPADFLWIDGTQQRTNESYLWTERKELIPDYLWCPRNQCDSIGREHVMLNLLCPNDPKLICLGTRSGWKLAPFVCKRPRRIDQCPVTFREIENLPQNELLVVTVNRTIAFIQCRHPNFYAQIKLKYQCDSSKRQWKLIYQNKNFTCPSYEIPPLAKSLIVSPSTTTTTTTTMTTTTTKSRCSETDFNSLINQLPTKSLYISHQDLFSTSSNYFDRRVVCSSNRSIHITYRCDRNNQRWSYVYGSSRSFRRCYPSCGHEEQRELLEKYFSSEEQKSIRIIRRSNRSVLRLRCFNSETNRFTAVVYRCGTLSLTTSQWFQLHSCSQNKLVEAPLPVVIVSMSIESGTRVCPPVVQPGSACQYERGEILTDTHGCARKVCPHLSQLCQTIRCPIDRVCRVIPCQSCVATDYLQAVCEFGFNASLCEFEKQLLTLTTDQSILIWQKEITARVEDYVREQRQRLRISSIQQ